MVRKYDTEEANRGKSFTYWLAVALICMAWVFAFKCYFSSYENQHPDISWAAPGMNVQIGHADGIYLWEETVLNAPAAGKVYYPKGIGPVRVSSGQTVAKVVTPSGAEKAVRAFHQGYFIAGTDGHEGSWRYSLIWPELSDKLPETQAAAMRAGGDAVEENAPVGKLIPMPQSLRFIGLTDTASAFLGQLENKSVRLMMDDNDTSVPAEVSISMKSGNKIKFLVVMPWFKPETVISRAGRITVEAGKAEGAIVPMSSVTERRGRRGVYLVRGTRVVFREVKGSPCAEGKFLVTEGINVGDPVVEDAKNGREGRIQVW